LIRVTALERPDECNREIREIKRTEENRKFRVRILSQVFSL